MLKIYVVAVGRLKERHWRSAQEDYLTRLRPMARVELIETPAAAITASFGPDQSIKREADGLLKRVPEGATVVALDVKGRSMSSENLADSLTQNDESGQPICFIIGGAAGLDSQVLERADWRLSLSAMTFPHEMARVILLEQVYRGLAIASGKKYHY